MRSFCSPRDLVVLYTEKKLAALESSYTKLLAALTHKAAVMLMPVASWPMALHAQPVRALAWT